MPDPIIKIIRNKKTNKFYALLKGKKYIISEKISKLPKKKIHTIIMKYIENKKKPNINKAFPTKQRKTILQPTKRGKLTRRVKQQITRARRINPMPENEKVKLDVFNAIRKQQDLPPLKLSFEQPKISEDTRIQLRPQQQPQAQPQVFAHRPQVQPKREAPKQDEQPVHERLLDVHKQTRRELNKAKEREERLKEELEKRKILEQELIEKAKKEYEQLPQKDKDKKTKERFVKYTKLREKILNENQKIEKTIKDIENKAIEALKKRETEIRQVRESAYKKVMDKRKLSDLLKEENAYPQIFEEYRKNFPKRKRFELDKEYNERVSKYNSNKKMLKFLKESLYDSEGSTFYKEAQNLIGHKIDELEGEIYSIEEDTQQEKDKLLQLILRNDGMLGVPFSVYIDQKKKTPNKHLEDIIKEQSENYQPLLEDIIYEQELGKDEGVGVGDLGLGLGLPELPKRSSEKPESKRSTQKGSGKRDNELDNIQIDNIMKNSESYIITIAADEIISKIVPRLKKNHNNSFIMNKSKSGTPGTHWIAIYITPKTLEYFDPLGDPPTNNFLKDSEKIVDVMSDNGYLYHKVNNVQREDNDETDCGWHSIKFIHDRDDGISFKEATGYNDHLRDDHINGEKQTHRFMKQHGAGFSYITGTGFWDSAKKVGKALINIVSKLPPPSAPSTKLKNILSKYGDYAVNNVTIVRKPIISAIGKFIKKLQDWTGSENKYDTLFHLYGNLDLQKDDKNIIIKEEMNQVMQMYVSDGKLESDAESMNAGKPPNAITFNDFYAKGVNAAGGGEGWYRYSGGDRNCQWHQKILLQANGMLTAELEKFIMQDVSKLLGSFTDIGNSAANAITDVAGSVTDLLGGKKIEDKNIDESSKKRQ